MSDLQQIGRLALRDEGVWFKAYYAMPNTMKGALILGMIRMKCIIERPERKREFMALMQQAVSDIIEEAFGTRPQWPEGPQPAPEHERKIIRRR